MKVNRFIFKQLLHKYYANKNNKFKFVIVVDFDNTLCYSNYPNCGDITPFGKFLQTIQDLDVCIILNTCRHDESLAIALEWCTQHNIRVDYANENAPERIAQFGDCRKISGDIEFDDTSYNFRMEDFN